MTTDEQLRYPIGKFIVPVSYTQEDMRGWITTIKDLPGKLRNAIINLNEKQLDTPYRPGGWTIKQVVHHLADSHMNALIRFKWALTEDKPTIKAYTQTDWALLPDYKLPVEPSLKMLEGIHQHLIALFEGLNEEQWDRYFIHPETGANIAVKRNLAMYAWHSEHHLGHITNTTRSF
jgi:hypothetical protein